MNFLAHQYLSGDNNQLKIGNFIADAVKGKQYLNYSKNIQNGILLHREIDYFTDNHIIVKKSKQHLNARYGHYKGVIIDIFYDHFLAKNWSNYHSIPLKKYTEQTYILMQENFNDLPSKIKYLLPVMVNDNWLLNYANKEGIAKVLNGMNNRTNKKGNLNLAINDLIAHYTVFEEEFIEFFENLRTFSHHKIKSF